MPRPASALITVAREPYLGDGPRWVVARAEAELVVRYGGLDDGELGLTAAMFDPPAGAFVVGRVGSAGPPVGGVGVRTVGPGLGEVRRLWVDPDWRGQGVARRLMAALEDAARGLGLSALRLATGERQPEAVALYKSSGWARAEVGGAACGLRFTKELTPAP
jgi:GNAT superfamily N-acetyltransferase